MTENKKPPYSGPVIGSSPVTGTSGAARFIAGDWGTTNLRLFLCDAGGLALETLNGPGAAQAGGRFAQVYASLTAEWTAHHGPLPAVLCGMVGSTLGWVQAPYVPCPAEPEQIAAACVSLQEGTVNIVPGLSCHNRFHAPDFLRGEETQVLGALCLDAGLRQERRVVCLPGTHTKWLVVENGRVSEFLSSPAGELFALLRDHSVLVRGAGASSPPSMEAFEKGLAKCHDFPQAQLLHRLFEARSRQLSGELSADEAAAFLSGLIIASDVRGALSILFDTPSTVFLVGAPQLTQLYARACAINGYDTHMIEGSVASLNGLMQIHRQLSQKGDQL